jgi:putative Mn2+ efflux pump MntP
MGIMSWAHDRADAMSLWDIGLLKVYCTAFGMIVGAYFAPFVLENAAWFIGVLVVAGIRVTYRWFVAERAPAQAAHGR